MLDKKTEAMLQAANALTADDLDCLRSTTAVATVEPADEESEEAAPTAQEDTGATGVDEDIESDDGSPPPQIPSPSQPAGRRRAAPTSAATATAGEYERQRTRESKVSTTCLGKPREGHDWWPVGTELVGRIGAEEFTVVVVENPQVKSGRSLQIRSGAAAGRVCVTPTRAAIEATEAYRQAHNLGRGGGITNGWDFWQPKA